MKDILKALIIGWSVVWAMCILSFTIFQGGQLIMMFVFAQAPWSIPVSFILVWLLGSLLIIGVPYSLKAVFRKKTGSSPQPKEDSTAE
ncbi:MAG: hypothetical protein CSYNP_03047 [Syntrophus sp. SKADARSKE-3]|nr:hypothetical protein [Syntrophus sp. SKADARSKE-3]